jgi:hypothetical protein
MAGEEPPGRVKPLNPPPPPPVPLDPEIGVVPTHREMLAVLVAWFRRRMGR